MEEAARQEFRHKPVLFGPCMELLQIRPDGVYLDGTVGGGGHSAGILERLGKGGRLIGIDRDRDALQAAAARLQNVTSEGTFRLHKANFADMAAVCAEEGVRPDGILLDIGVSSFQLDTAQRGFSYRADAFLDMRMDADAPLRAYDVVNTYPQQKLRRILSEYGEERWAARIAGRIAAARERKPIETTLELAELVKAAVPAGAGREDGHPAKRTFQAIRIEVNGELDALRRAIDDALVLLRGGGRLVIITFHSLEDRIVKQKFREAADPCICPPDFPVCVCGRRSMGTVVTAKPVTADDAELQENNRAHSAKMRAFEKRREDAEHAEYGERVSVRI